MDHAEGGLGAEGDEVREEEEREEAEHFGKTVEREKGERMREGEILIWFRSSGGRRRRGGLGWTVGILVLTKGETTPPMEREGTEGGGKGTRVGSGMGLG